MILFDMNYYYVQRLSNKTHFDPSRYELCANHILCNVAFQVLDWSSEASNKLFLHLIRFNLLAFFLSFLNIYIYISKQWNLVIKHLAAHHSMANGPIISVELFDFINCYFRNETELNFSIDFFDVIRLIIYIVYRNIAYIAYSSMTGMVKGRNDGIQRRFFSFAHNHQMHITRINYYQRPIKAQSIYALISAWVCNYRYWIARRKKCISFINHQTAESNYDVDAECTGSKSK